MSEQHQQRRNRPQRQPRSREERYTLFNRAVSGIVLCCLILPILISWFPSRLSQFLPTCTYLTLTGNPCPLCGLTRALAAITRLDISHATYLNVLAIPLFIILLCELIYRTILSFRRLPAGRLKFIVTLDFRIHLVLALLYLIYAAVFLLRS